jgi:hypothetical protein
MNPRTLTLIALLATLALLPLASQTTPPTPVPRIPAAPQAPDPLLPQLEVIRAANDALIKRQEAAVKRIDELKSEAQQLRIYSKRT